MNKTEFDTAISRARPGDNLTYFSGSLCFASKWQRLVARAALRAYKDGIVDLVQRRVQHAKPESGVGRFEYIAIKRLYVIPRVNFELPPLDSRT